MSVFDVCLLTGSASGEDKRPPRHYEFWAGVDFAEQAWLAYSGATYSPFNDIHEEGWKLRLATGYGTYAYQTRLHTNGRGPRANVMFLDAMLGYMWRLDPFIPKIFVGMSAIDHNLPNFDGFQVVNGEDIGLRVQAELWINLSKKSWASFDVSWTQAHNTRSARIRTGYRLFPRLSVGVENSFHSDNQTFCIVRENEVCTELSETQALQRALLDNSRVGAFARYDWDGGEISATFGLAGYDRPQEQFFGKLHYLMQF